MVLKTFGTNIDGKAAYGLYLIRRPDSPASKVKIELVRDAGGIIQERTKSQVKVFVKAEVGFNLAL